MATPDVDEQYSIGEVSEMVDQEAHVLRYWEQEFDVLSPDKDRAGRRVYTDADVETIRKICYLLKEEMYTIAGARKALKRSEQEALEEAAHRTDLRRLRSFLVTLRESL